MKHLELSKRDIMGITTCLVPNCNCKKNNPFLPQQTFQKVDEK